MFDQVTSDLIKNGVYLEDLDLDKLPQKLTEAYSSVISTRLKVIESEDILQSDDWSQREGELYRIAETFEAYTILLDNDNPHKDSCAFVAGTSHFTIKMANDVLNTFVNKPSLSHNSLSPEVSATLLFLSSGQFADAFEASKRFNSESLPSSMICLLKGINSLASGNGKRIREFVYSPVEIPHPSLEIYELASQTLWYRLVIALQHLSRKLLGLDSENDPLIIIENVLSSIENQGVGFDYSGTNYNFSFDCSGVYHCAKLLKLSCSKLLESSIFHIPTPDGVVDENWHNYLRDFGLSRPFLWQNHKKIIDKNFLNYGKSFVITFPTGSGKTTLTELRIAVEVLRGNNIVYIVPTRALVDQVSQNIEIALKSIGSGFVQKRLLEDFGERVQKSVYVQTPEQCISFMAQDISNHTELSLVVVDEFHQISGAIEKGVNETRLPNKRDIDAMWCLLSLHNRSELADVIMISAMVENGQEISDWIEKITERPSCFVDYPWKPTRQVRGIVVYDSDDIRSLKEKVESRRSQGSFSRNPNSAEKRNLTISPIGIFCHTQIWSTESTFSNFKLLNEEVPLSINNNWYLTPNKNVVAAHLLSALSLSGIKSLVFTQNVSHTNSIAKKGTDLLCKKGFFPVVLLDKEIEWYNAAAIELGDDSLVYRPIKNCIGVHHSLLLPQERLATESAYKRNDGLTALVATPTVTQGINLPAEAVIIAGDDRYSSENGQEILNAHELLNAAGRAGRAGHYAHGIVFNIPGVIQEVTKDENTFSLTDINRTLGLFGVSDQCLKVVDPITQILDQITTKADEYESQYFLKRVSEMNPDSLKAILLKSLGNMAARGPIIDKQIENIKSVSKTLDETDHELLKWKELSFQLAISPDILRVISVAIEEQSEQIRGMHFDQLLKFMIDILLNRSLLFSILDPYSSSLDTIVKQSDKESKADWEERWESILKEILPLWISGYTLIEIGNVLKSFCPEGNRMKPEILGRRFALKVSDSIGYGMSIIGRVLIETIGDGLPIHIGSWIELMNGCLREGFDNPDKTLVYWELNQQYKGLFPRVKIHQQFKEIEYELPEWVIISDISTRRESIKAIIAFDNLFNE